LWPSSVWPCRRSACTTSRKDDDHDETVFGHDETAFGHHDILGVHRTSRPIVTMTDLGPGWGVVRRTYLPTDASPETRI